MIKQLKENWAIFLLIWFSLYMVYVSSNKVDIAEREVKKYKAELDSIKNLNKSIK